MYKKTYHTPHYPICTTDVINETQIKFNDNLKAFIKRMQLFFKNDLEYQCPDNTDAAQDFQHEAREYIIEHQNELDWYKKKTLQEHDTNSYKEFYALMICFIAHDIDNCVDYNECLNQIDKDFMECLMSFNTNTEFNPDYIMSSRYSFCMCSHRCCSENMYVIRNIQNGYYLFIGCSCVEKNEIIELDVIKEAKRKMKETNPLYKEKERKRKEKKAEKKKKRIDDLLLLQIADDFNRKRKNKRLLSLFKSLIYKRCKDCNLQVIPRREARSRPRCLGCYIKYKTPPPGVCIINLPEL